MLKRKEISVPDQVLFGLILGIIVGPLMYFPNKKAVESLIKDNKIIRKKKFLSNNISLKMA